MKTIWKFAIEQLDDTVTMHMPLGAEVLYVDTQYGIPCIWARVDDEAPQVQRTFYVRGTGHPLLEAEDAAHIGSFQLHGGQLVFHVFTKMEATS